jgi:hypothetical protein
VEEGVMPKDKTSEDGKPLADKKRETDENHPRIEGHRNIEAGAMSSMDRYKDAADHHPCNG